MKIFNIENGQEKVYVQRSDIQMLSNVDEAFPGIIYEAITEHGIIIIDNSNRDDFIGFTEQSVIDFFKGQDWLVDYKEYRALSIDDIIEVGQGLTNEMNEIARKYNNMSLEGQKTNSNLLIKRNFINHKVRDLAKIVWLKQGNLTIPFPIVPDSHGFKVTSSYKSINFELASSIDPNCFLVYRQDGGLIYELSSVPAHLVESGLGYSIAEKQDSDFFIGDYKQSFVFSGDNKYLIVKNEIVINKPKEVYKGFVKRLFLRDKDKGKKV